MKRLLKTRLKTTFKELSENNGIEIDRIKWSYYESFILDKRYLVVKKEEINVHERKKQNE